MKKLLIPFLADVNHGSSPNAIEAALTPLDATNLMEVAWPAYPYKPTVYFKIAHTVDSILLKYVIKEEHVKAAYRNTNDPVYKDSCVEFFLSFDGVHYYNLEFNCMGTGLIGHGNADKGKRRKLPNGTVEKVRTHSRIHAKNHGDTDTTWHLLLDIPFTVFDADTINSLTGLKCTGNFYKCGDELPAPHYVSWNRIDYPVPNFHLPKFFGDLQFL
ncbi:carbohydrate-binding family 9-like protein [Parapedobacter tibetensis]|uniref:carbohydrate-binding family 9-like protein n=1 Tax=Parapedobacter tibetensis TaxID=2972951 RepID=UPI00214D3CA5|nr:carbohydrate-binding family 9-like protein [Parapedobacter tibetensis]